MKTAAFTLLSITLKARKKELTFIQGEIFSSIGALQVSQCVLFCMNEGEARENRRSYQYGQQRNQIHPE
jgi:hypothetical protein